MTLDRARLLAELLTRELGLVEQLPVVASTIWLRLTRESPREKISLAQEISELDLLKRDRDHWKQLAERLASDALGALAGAVCTPEKGYVAEPECLGGDIEELRKLRNRVQDEKKALLVQVEELKEEVERVKDELFKANERVHEYQREVERRDEYLAGADHRVKELEGERDQLRNKVDSWTRQDAFASKRLIAECDAAQASARKWQEAALEERDGACDVVEMFVGGIKSAIRNRGQP